MSDFLTDNTGSDGGFPEYRRLILTELKRLGRDQEVLNARTEGQITSLRDTFMIKFESLQTQISDLRSEVKASERERKVLSSVWGLLGGAMPIILWFVYQIMAGM